MGQHLTVFHIRSKLAKTITDSYTSILRKPRTVKAFDLSTDMPFEARLFISKAELKPPPWMNFLKVGFDKLPTPSRKIHSAVLFVRIPYGETKEIFAFTFGQGRHLLKSHSYDDDYGLRTALNAIYQQEETLTPDRLKNVAAKTVAANTMRTRRQTDKRTSFESFGVERLHAHLCRHAFVINYLLNGGDIFSLREILGHTTLEMVNHYLHFTSSQITDQHHKKHSPMDRLQGVSK